MARATDFVSEFLEENQRTLVADRRAVQSQISSNLQRGQETEAAFAALEQTQQPTTVDKVGDIGLAVAGIADLLTGPKRRRGEAGAKFRALKAGREAEKTAKRDRQTKKFLQQVKLKELTGDIANRNLALALGLSEQERRATKSNLDAILQVRREAKSEEEFNKRFEEQKRQFDKKLELSRKSAAQTAQEAREQSYEKAVKRIGTFKQAQDAGLLGDAFGQDALLAYERLLDRTADQILASEFGISLQSPQADVGEFNPADFLPATEGAADLGPGLLLPKGTDPNLINLPPSPLEQRRAAISPFLVPQR